MVAGFARCHPVFTPVSSGCSGQVASGGLRVGMSFSAARGRGGRRSGRGGRGCPGSSPSGCGAHLIGWWAGYGDGGFPGSAISRGVVVFRRRRRGVRAIPAVCRVCFRGRYLAMGSSFVGGGPGLVWGAWLGTRIAVAWCAAPCSVVVFRRRRGGDVTWSRGVIAWCAGPCSVAGFRRPPDVAAWSFSGDGVGCVWPGRWA